MRNIKKWNKILSAGLLVVILLGVIVYQDFRIRQLELSNTAYFVAEKAFSNAVSYDQNGKMILDESKAKKSVETSISEISVNNSIIAEAVFVKPTMVAVVLDSKYIAKPIKAAGAIHIGALPD